MVYSQRARYSLFSNKENSRESSQIEEILVDLPIPFNILSKYLSQKQFGSKEWSDEARFFWVGRGHGLFHGFRGAMTTKQDEKMIVVCGAGWGRTSTNSLKVALEQLYGEPCYHMKEVIDAGTKHVSFWANMADGKPGDFHCVEFGTKFRCAVDWPVCNYWKEILKANPEAKVVLSIHPKGAEGWYNSCMSTIFNFQPEFKGRSWIHTGVAVSLMCGLPALGFGDMVNKNVGGALNHDYSKENCMRLYDEHIATVIRECPKDKLLVFKATDGWEPLCKFLNMPVPNGAYPHVNDSKEFQWAIKLMNRVGWTILLTPIILLTYFTSRNLHRNGHDGL